MDNEQFQPGIKVLITSGKFIGRTGTIKRRGSSVFPEFCRVSIDLTSREKAEKTEMFKYDDLELFFETIECPECLRKATPEELNLFGGLCEECSTNQD